MELQGYLTEYIQCLEEVKIKRGLQIAISASSACNSYLQETQAWS